MAHERALYNVENKQWKGGKMKANHYIDRPLRLVPMYWRASHCITCRGLILCQTQKIWNILADSRPTLISLTLF